MKRALRILALAAILATQGCLSITDAQLDRLMQTAAVSNVLARVEARLDAEIAKEEALLAGSPTPTPEAESPAGDEPALGVAYSALKWTFGGVNGAKSALSTPKISNFKLSGDKMTIRWDVGMEGWGLARTEPGALACLFVQKENGDWVGGKFEWISTSRAGRTFKNVRDGYGGWTLSGVPNPCRAAFVVITPDGKKRTNLLESEWQR